MPGKKLLVADDSLTIQKVIRLALSNEGYEIQAVSDGNDAIQQIALFHPDIVLIDVSLPGKTAFEVKRDINTHGDLEEVRFILMSSAFERVDEEQADEVVFHGRLTKPFDPAHLRQVLTDVLGQVTAKRMEKTSILTRPNLGEINPPPLPSPPLSFPPEDHSPLTLEPPSLPSRSLTESEEEEWTHELEPDDLPPLPKPTPEQVQELWEPEPTISLEPPSPPSPPSSQPPQLENLPDDHDIKHLTETTMRGLEDFQWSVNEPSLKPLPKMFDHGDSNFEIPISHDEFPEPPTKPYSSQVPAMEDMLEPPSFLPSDPELPENNFVLEMDPPAAFQTPPPLTRPVEPTITEDQLERIIRSQVETLVEKLAKKLIPEVAEKVIKQEIHRLLSE